MKQPDLPVAPVPGPETMFAAIRKLGVVPFFSNPVSGFSIEDLTPRECWFTGETLGPWDWKVDVVNSGEIVYGKFLCGGKSAFATVRWYRELMTWRRAQEKYRPEGMQRMVVDAIAREGEMTTRQLRALTGLKKTALDALMTRLQMAMQVVIGNIERVYNGPDLSYKGWQHASFCRPDDLMDIAVADSAEASWEALAEHIRSLVPDLSEKVLVKLLG